MACTHHESIGHRLGRLEDRMDRVEKGIFGALVAILIGMISIFIQVWDLPTQIKMIQATQTHQGK